MAWTQKAFDDYRQQIWDQGTSLVRAHDEAKNKGQLTTAMLASLIVSLSTLMESFRSTYLDARAKDAASVLFGGLSPAWIDPRFHDYYDFFTQKIIPPWEAELQGMQAATSQVVAAQPTSTGSTMQFSSVNTSQAGASSTPIPQPAYVPTQQYTAPIDNQTTVVEQAYDTSPETKSALMSPLIIGGLVLGLLFMGRKKSQ